MREIHTTEREIIKLQKQIDDNEWEGLDVAPLQQQLKQLYVILSLGGRGEWQTNW